MSNRSNYSKKPEKIFYPRFNSAKIYKKLTSKIYSFPKPLSGNIRDSTRNKKKLLITNILSTSKHFIIKGDRTNVGGSENFSDNIRYEYPYKPGLLSKLNDELTEKKLTLFEKINNLTKSAAKMSVLSSNESNKSTFKSSSQNTTQKYLINRNYYNHIKSSETQYNKINLISPKTASIKIIKRTFINNMDSQIFNNDKEISMGNNITGESFMKFIDNINGNIKLINKYKEKLGEYFNKFNKSELYVLKELLNNYTYEENKDENYFLNNEHSTKKNILNIKDLKITLKLSSLKFIFYEIKYDKSNKISSSNNSYNNNYINKEKYIFNSKIKFPLEFLSIFYGLNFEEFINLMLALIDFDFNTNKFYIDYNIFKSKVEDCKILYDFFTEKSFAMNFNSNNSKEYFLFNWEIKEKNNEIKHYCIKMLLPQMKIKINYAEKNKFKFYSNISIQTINNLFKNSFNNWDLYILIYFSEHKIFRYEINKIICGKYSHGGRFSNKDFIYNLTNSTTKMNTLIKNNNSYSFFYSYLNDQKMESYFIKFKLPQISISFKNFSKQFDIDYKRLHQLSKLRKYFYQEDLIKYSMTVKKIRTKIKRIEQEKREMRRFISSKTLKPDKRNSTRLSIEMKNKKSNFKKLIKDKIRKKQNELLGLNQQIQQSQKTPEFEEIIKDIDLNLDKYIFNFDETILKYINIKEIHKNNFNDSEKNNDDNNAFHVNNNKKLNIEIGNLELSWTNKDGLTNIYTFDKKTSQYLFDFPIIKWRLYVENNIEKIIKGKPNIRKTYKNKKTSFFQKKVQF